MFFLNIDIEKLHLIGNNDNMFVYYNLNLFSIDGVTCKIIQLLQEGNDINKISSELGLSFQFIENKLRFLAGTANTDYSLAPKVEKRKVQRITLHVSNDCNLRCKYCYANGGNYHLERKLMSEATAELFVKFCIREFDEIGEIVFFGGEPLMNLSIMQRICISFNEAFNDHRIKAVPAFNLITNGTLLNEMIIRFIQKYIKRITVSIDGPKFINDQTRIFANGNGSYDSIINFIQTIKKETNTVLQYEVTYTKLHKKYGLTYSKIREIMRSEHGIEGVIVPEYGPLEVCSSDLDCEEILNSDLDSLPGDFYYILQRLKKSEAAEMCNIVNDIFAVSVDGDIYPCHMNVGERNTCLGNIAGNNIFDNGLAYPIFGCKNNELCNACWANELCGGCARFFFYDINNKVYNKLPNSKNCDETRKYIHSLLYLIGCIRTDDVKWKELLSLAKRIKYDAKY